MSETFVFGVDLDGVCGDYTGAFRQIVAEELGVTIEQLPLERNYDFDEWGLSADQFAQLHYDAVIKHRMLAKLPVMEGCADALWRLSDAGIWIRVITHRLYVNWGHATVVSDTVTWLDEARIPYRDLCFLGHKPQVGADVYVDDAPHNLTGLAAAGNEVIIFDQPYNRSMEGRRAHNWDEVLEMVFELAAGKGAVQRQLPGIDAGADRLERRTI